MSIRFLLGLSGSGKSFRCIREILDSPRELSLVYVVPEQYSLQAEMDLISASDCKGIMNAQILTFKRMAFRILSESGNAHRKSFDETCKMMLLRKILIESKNDLCFFRNSVDKRGFIDELSGIINSFFKFCILPDDIKSLCFIDNTALQMKLNDLYLIYSKYLLFIEEQFLSTEQLLDFLADNIRDSFISTSYVWIDGFHSFTPQEYRVISKIFEVAPAVTVALTIAPSNINFATLCESDPFFQTQNTLRVLSNLAGKLNAKIELIPMNTNLFRFANSSDINHLSLNYFKYPICEYDDVPHNIRLFAASNRYLEVRDVALKILELVASGYRYREIAVVTNSLTGYEVFLKGIFSDFNIPFFYDYKNKITNFPLIELVRAAIDIINTNWSYESVFRYLKTGLTGIDRDDIDLLENYVLAYGIRGKKWLEPSWEFGFDSFYERFNIDDINFIKDEIVCNLAPLIDNVKSGKKYTVLHITVKLIEFLDNLQVTSVLSDIIERLQINNEIRLASENMQIWDALMNILSKAVDILGDEEVTIAEYSKILNDAFVENSLGAIPPGIDQIIIGDLLRTRLPSIRALFVIGVNDGLLPSSNTEFGLFNDLETTSLNSAGFDFIKSGRTKSFEEQFLIYLTLSKASNFLNISYSLGDIDGKSMHSSIIVRRIKKMFPKLIECNESNITPLSLISKPTPTFTQLSIELRNYINGKHIYDDWKDVFSWFYLNRLSDVNLLINELLNSNLTKNLSAKSIKRIYGDNLYTSVSRLEKFMTCPFSYYVQYKLNAKERKLYKVHHPDLGTLFHNILDNFSKQLISDGLNWRNLDKNSIELMVEASVDKLAPQMGNKILFSSGKYQYLIRRLKRISKRAVWALSEHIKSGAFEPFAFELGFDSTETLPPIVVEVSSKQKLILTGRIDRIDILNSDGSTFVKIIDYKSGNKKFSLDSIYYGIQLQLMIYLDSLLKSSEHLKIKNLMPGGVFYFKIDDPLISAVETMTETEIEQLLLKELKLSGLVLNNTDIIRALDENISGTSTIIPVSMKKDGTLGKNSSVATIEEFETICSYVNNIIKEIGNEILSGNIDISPTKDNNTTACTYCLYNAICRFDNKLKNNNYRELHPHIQNISDFSIFQNR